MAEIVRATITSSPPLYFYLNSESAAFISREDVRYCTLDSHLPVKVIHALFPQYAPNPKIGKLARKLPQFTSEKLGFKGLNAYALAEKDLQGKGYTVISWKANNYGSLSKIFAEHFEILGNYLYTDRGRGFKQVSSRANLFTCSIDKEVTYLGDSGKPVSITKALDRLCPVGVINGYVYNLNSMKALFLWYVALSGSKFLAAVLRGFKEEVLEVEVDDQGEADLVHKNPIGNGHLFAPKVVTYGVVGGLGQLARDYRVCFSHMGFRDDYAVESPVYLDLQECSPDIIAAQMSQLSSTQYNYVSIPGAGSVPEKASNRSLLMVGPACPVMNPKASLLHYPIGKFPEGYYVFATHPQFKYQVVNQGANALGIFTKDILEMAYSLPVCEGFKAEHVVFATVAANGSGQSYYHPERFKGITAQDPVVERFTVPAKLAPDSIPIKGYYPNQKIVAGYANPYDHTFYVTEYSSLPNSLSPESFRDVTIRGYLAKTIKNMKVRGPNLKASLTPDLPLGKDHRYQFQDIWDAYPQAQIIITMECMKGSLLTLAACPWKKVTVFNMDGTLKPEDQEFYLKWMNDTIKPLDISFEVIPEMGKLYTAAGHKVVDNRVYQSIECLECSMVMAPEIPLVDNRTNNSRLTPSHALALQHAGINALYTRTTLSQVNGLSRLHRMREANSKFNGDVMENGVPKELPCLSQIVSKVNRWGHLIEELSRLYPDGCYVGVPQGYIYLDPFVLLHLCALYDSNGAVVLPVDVLSIRLCNLFGLLTKGFDQYTPDEMTLILEAISEVKWAIENMCAQPNTLKTVCNTAKSGRSGVFRGHDMIPSGWAYVHPTFAAKAGFKEGQPVIAWRYPLIFSTVLRIKTTTMVGISEIYVSPLEAIVSAADFDGDQGNLIPVLLTDKLRLTADPQENFRLIYERTKDLLHQSPFGMQSITYLSYASVKNLIGWLKPINLRKKYLYAGPLVITNDGYKSLLANQANFNTRGIGRIYNAAHDLLILALSINHRGLLEVAAKAFLLYEHLWLACFAAKKERANVLFERLGAGKLNADELASTLTEAILEAGIEITELETAGVLLGRAITMVWQAADNKAEPNPMALEILQDNGSDEEITKLPALIRRMTRGEATRPEQGLDEYLAVCSPDSILIKFLKTRFGTYRDCIEGVYETKLLKLEQKI